MRLALTYSALAVIAIGLIIFFWFLAESAALVATQ